jgi:hypothetical protein
MGVLHSGGLLPAEGGRLARQESSDRWRSVVSIVRRRRSGVGSNAHLRVSSDFGRTSRLIRRRIQLRRSELHTDYTPVIERSPATEQIRAL